jgi:hypothetical protein
VSSSSGICGIAGSGEGHASGGEGHAGGGKGLSGGGRLAGDGEGGGHARRSFLFYLFLEKFRIFLFFRDY